MTRQVVLRQPSSTHRRHPLLAPAKTSSSRRVGEFAGGTAAECAAVCCCCPCALLDLIFLAVFKLPAAACRRALRRPLHRRKGLPPRRCSSAAVSSESGGDVSPVMSLQWDTDVMRLEKEMWDQFDGTGFWRSPSQREKIRVDGDTWKK